MKRKIFSILLALAWVLSLSPVTAAPVGTHVGTASATYDSGDNDRAYGVAVDSEGNIIVTGTSYGATSNYYTIKYDPTLSKVLGKATYDGGYDDVAYGVAVDSEGNIIVTGSSFDGETWNYYTIKYETLKYEIRWWPYIWPYRPIDLLQKDCFSKSRRFL